MRVFVRFIIVAILSTGALAQDRVYRLKAGDTIDIWVEQDANLRRQAIVAPDGRIALPLAGHLRAAGLTPEGLEKAIASRLQKNFTTGVDVTVSILTTPEPEYEHIIYVTGEVRTPGSLTVTRPTTILQALALSGGLSEFAAKKRIHVRRRQNDRNFIIPFNYRDVETARDVTGNVYLRDGDVIVVPERRLFE